MKETEVKAKGLSDEEIHHEFNQIVDSLQLSEQLDDHRPDAAVEQNIAKDEQATEQLTCSTQQDCSRIEKAAWQKHEAQVMPAWLKYNMILESAWQKRCTIEQVAWTTYNEGVQPAQRRCEEAKCLASTRNDLEELQNIGRDYLIMVRPLQQWRLEIIKTAEDEYTQSIKTARAAYNQIEQLAQQTYNQTVKNAWVQYNKQSSRLA